MPGRSARERVLAAINHARVDRVPLMYRGLPETDAKVCEHFGLGHVDGHWNELVERLGADLLSGGSSMGRYARISPRYVGPADTSGSLFHLEYAWGIFPPRSSAETHTYIDWIDHPMAALTTVREIEAYPSPRIEDFDFASMAIDPSTREHALSSTGRLNHVFMLSARLRGMDRLLMDMAAEPRLAEAVVNKVGEFAVEFNRRALAQLGDQLDHYVLWDDVAMQNGLIMGPDHWHRYLRKWYEALYADAKSYGLKVFCHCCGSLHDIIPTLLDIGVDILDPVQTSARDMDLRTLKQRYGRNVCWHGGIDVQQLLPHGRPSDVRAAVREAEALFGLDGGIVLGPSHEITPDTPVENILAIYGL